MAAMSGKSSERVLVVIVNYRTADLVAEGLASLEQEVLAHPGSRVVVVDNDSGDGSAEKLQSLITEKSWQSWADVIASPVNGGFSSGNNIAIRQTLESRNTPDFFWLVNPDAWVYPGAMQALLSFARTHPRAGILGSALTDENGPWRVAFRFPSLPGQIESGLRLGVASKLLDRWRTSRDMGDEPAIVDWVSGASMFVRREVYSAIGLMDEGFFLYFEETDFCLRAHRAGWECWYVPDSKVHHIRGQSTGVTELGSKRRLPNYWFDSRRRYFIKSHGLTYAILADLLWIASLSLWRLRRRLQKKPDTDPSQLLIDSITQSTFLKGWQTKKQLQGRP